MDRVEDLALALIYLMSWDEDPKRKYSSGPALRAWKNIRFEILDKLNEEGFLRCSNGKSVGMTSEGIVRAKECLARLHLEDPHGQ